jgi:hypothetical protein
MMREGDFLPGCLIPVFNPDFGSRGDSEEIPLAQANLIVVTQTCDLAHGKASVACAIRTMSPALSMCCQSKGSIPSRDSVVK